MTQQFYYGSNDYEAYLNQNMVTWSDLQNSGPNNLTGWWTNTYATGNIINYVPSANYLNNLGNGIYNYNNWNNFSIYGSIGGGQHALATQSDGSLWSWGVNTYGQLGVGSVTSQSTPIQIGISAWRSIAAGQVSSHAVRSDGSMWCWGYNAYGQLGVGNTTNLSTPVQVGSQLNWQSVSASTAVIAVKNDGTMWGWGYNSQYQLGLGDTVNRSSPVQIGSGNLWKSVYVGQYSVVAIAQNGTLWGWGNNAQGELGLGYAGSVSTPVMISSSSWKSVAVANLHILYLNSDGRLWSCGVNASGELGNGTITQSSNLVQVGNLSNWQSVAVISKDSYGGASFGIKTDGTVWGWGSNVYYQLTTSWGTGYSSSTPIQIGSGNNWRSISAGYHCTIATYWPMVFNSQG